MDNLLVLEFSKLLKTMFTKECGYRTKPPDFVCSVSQIVQKSKVAKVQKYGQTEAIISEISQMELNKVWVFISGQMVQDIKETGQPMKCQEKVHLSGRMVVTLKVSSKMG